MAFVLSQTPHYEWPVEYRTPIDGGKYKPSAFVAEFKRLPQSRLDEIFKGATEDEVDDDAVLDEVLMGWSDIKDQEGNEFECTDANRRILLDLPGMRSTLLRAYFGSIEGAARKNSKRPRHTG